MTSSLRTGSTRAARPAQLRRATGRRAAIPLAGIAAVAAIATTIAVSPAQTPLDEASNVPSVAQLAQSGAQSYSADVVAAAQPAGQAAPQQSPDLGRGDAVSIAVETPTPTPTPTPEPAPAPSQPDSSGSGGGDSSGPAVDSSGYGYTTPSGEAQQIAAQLVAARGWGDGEFTCLVKLWDKESGWNTHAENPSSGAYGIPQSLPGSKMATAGSDWRDNPATQITWGLGYIADRYGSPCGAWGHSQSVGWY